MKKNAHKCESVSLVTPLALLRMLEVHLKDADYTTTEMEDILFNGGLITLEDIRPTVEES